VIKERATELSVSELCELFDVSPSGYYAWVSRKPCKRRVADLSLIEHIREVHSISRKTYGSPRITRTLRRNGMKCSRKRVARLMKQKGLHGAQKARFCPRTTDSRHDLPISPNLIADLPSVERVNQVWVSDITYIPTLEGWMYLAAFMDLKSRKIKGWTIQDHMRTELVETAFRRAVFREAPPAGLIVHSDRGSQYASRDFRRLLEQHHAVSSMSA
jgi:transposase InsO family protein